MRDGNAVTIQLEAKKKDPLTSFGNFSSIEVFITILLYIIIIFLQINFLE